MSEVMYYCRACGRDSFLRRGPHKKAPGSGNPVCPGDFVEQRVESCFCCKWRRKKACPDPGVIGRSPWMGCGAWVLEEF